MNGRATRYDVVVTTALFLAAMLAQRFEWFALFEDQTLSFRHQLRLAFGNATTLAPAPEVVLVNTDEPFFEAYKSFPLRRTDIGAVVTNLKSSGAKGIAVDNGYTNIESDSNLVTMLSCHLTAGTT